MSLNLKILLISCYTFILNIDTAVGCFGKWRTPIYLQDSRIVSFYAKTNLNRSYYKISGKYYVRFGFVANKMD